MLVIRRKNKKIKHMYFTNYTGSNMGKYIAGLTLTKLADNQYRLSWEERDSKNGFVIRRSEKFLTKEEAIRSVRDKKVYKEISDFLKVKVGEM